ncbi:MAG: regulatory protein RecX [Chloroflexota bacterium]
MVHNKDISQALARSYRLLQHRMRSTSEVRTRLLRAGFTEDVVEEVLETLTRQELLDDEAFARSWTDERRNLNPRSSSLIQKELRAKGVASELVAQVTEDIDDDEAALELAQHRAESMSGMDRSTFLRRLSRYLYNRGFAHATVARALMRVEQSRNVS